MQAAQELEMEKPAESATGYRKGFMFVMSSPSGAGKTTLSRMLLESEEHITMSVSATTRPMRPGEVEGVDYQFVEQTNFDEMVESGEMLEYAGVFNQSYGTPQSFVDDKINNGIDVLFDIDWQGTRQLAAKRRSDLVSIFILPPSMKELERRLHSRAQDSEEVVKYRMERAADEISHWEEYDYVVINHDIEDSLRQIRHILHAERYKRTRQTSLPEYIKWLCDYSW